MRSLCESEAKVNRISFKISLTVTTAFLSIANSAAALAIPVSSFDGLPGGSITLVRGQNNGRPGGGYYGSQPGGRHHGWPGYGARHRPGANHGWGGAHHGWHGGNYGGWRRPYRWSPGGAIAAGAAIGFMSAVAAGAIASSAAPAPGLCWYYTDASRRAGFWDACPR